MCPDGKTSLVAEVPVASGLRLDYQQQIQKVTESLQSIGLINHQTILKTAHYRLSNAYPVLDLSDENASKVIDNRLRQFSNMTYSGRTVLYQYTHIHGLMEQGRRGTNSF